MAKPTVPAVNASPAEPAAPSFESALAELEGIVAAMESGQLPLQESLDAYKRRCRDTLSAAEQQLRILEGGELRDFDPQRGPTGADAEG